MNTLKGVRRYSLLLPRYCIFAVFFIKMPWFLKEHHESCLSIFDLTLCKEKGINENSYCEIRTSNLPIYMNYIKYTLSPHPYLTIGTTKRSETFTMNYFRWCLSLCKVSSRKSEVSFRDAA